MMSDAMRRDRLQCLQNIVCDMYQECNRQHAIPIVPIVIFPKLQAMDTSADKRLVKTEKGKGEQKEGSTGQLWPGY